VVPITAIRTASDFLTAFDQGEAFRIDTSAVTDDAALDLAAAMADWITDTAEIRGECYLSQQVEQARVFVAVARLTHRPPPPPSEVGSSILPSSTISVPEPAGRGQATAGMISSATHWV